MGEPDLRVLHLPRDCRVYACQGLVEHDEPRIVDQRACERDLLLHAAGEALAQDATDDLLDLRVKGALPRMEALTRVVEQYGVNFMATICAICKAQFTKVLPYYGFKMGMVGGVHQLVSTAIVLNNEQ